MTTTTPAQGQTCVDRLVDRLTPCWFAFRALLGDGAAVERERRERDFRRDELPVLLGGGAFLLVKGVDDALADAQGGGGGGGGGGEAAADDDDAQRGAASRAALTAMERVEKLAAVAKGTIFKKTPKPDEPVMLRLVLPASKPLALTTPPPSIMERVNIQMSNLAETIASVASGEDAPPEATKTIAVVWSSLALEQNKPRSAGKVSLHRVQLVKERGPGFVLLDHNGEVLLEVKIAGDRAAQASIEAGRWVKALENALVCLAAQIEEEAAAVRGSSYRAKRLEQLRLRDEERARQKAALGSVGMTYTAKIMAAR